MTTKDKIKALRLSHLVLSLGLDGAQAHLKALSPKERAHYFPSKNVAAIARGEREEHT